MFGNPTLPVAQPQSADQQMSEDFDLGNFDLNLHIQDENED
jgi:hypothetical protein